MQNSENGNRFMVKVTIIRLVQSEVVFELVLKLKTMLVTTGLVIFRYIVVGMTSILISCTLLVMNVLIPVKLRLVVE